MKSSIIKNERQWLRTPETGVTTFGATKLCRPLEIPMPPEIGVSTCRSVQLPIRVAVYSGSHRFAPTVADKLLPYSKLDLVFSEPTLTIFSLKTGRALSNDAIGASQSFGLSAGTLFNHLLETAAGAGLALDLREHIHWVSVIFRKSVLCTLVGETVALRILEALQIQRIPSARVAKIPRRITSILHSCMPDHLSGEIGILYAQAKILEFICELAGWLDSVTAQPEPKAIDRETFWTLHEELTTLAGRSPTLTELSRKYGRSGKALNQGFKELFGCSIYTYVSDQRLVQAHDALMASDAPMKLIAVNLGYSHVNHFSNAFRKKFGYPPGSLRK